MRLTLPARLLPCLWICAAFAGELPKVLVVESYHAAYLWDAGYTGALQHGLAGRAKLSFFEMDTKRLPKESHAAMGDKAWALIQASKPDAVVLGDDAALKFLGPRLAGSRLPVVYLGINGSPTTYLDKPAPNITGVLERPSIRQTLLLAKQMQPELKRILVLLDTDLTSKQMYDYTFQSRPRQMVAGIDVSVQLVDTLAAWQKAVQSFSGPDHALLMLTYFSLKEGERPVSGQEVLEWTTGKAGIPTYCNNDYAIGRGLAMAGYVNAAAEQGAQAVPLILAKLADPMRVMPPVTPSTYRLLISRSAIARWGIAVPRELQEKAEWVD
ncbi:ABC transporter substrate-binding protein [Chitinimonas arctica]|nr:ABC transporter substrate binding protein [Chitinimonas arctica]